MGKQLTNGVWLNDKFWPAGSTPPKDVADQITNPRAWDDDKTFDGDDGIVVGAPTAEQIAAAADLADKQMSVAPNPNGDGDGDGDEDGAKQAPASVVKKAPAKKATAKKAPAKKSAASAS